MRAVDRERSHSDSPSNDCLVPIALAARATPVLRQRFGGSPWAVTDACARVVAFAIGPVAAFWLIQRTVSFFTWPS